MSTPDPRRAAENALWYALEERRDEIRAAGLGFSERQHDRLRTAHEEKRLISAMCAAMERYKKGGGDPYYLQPMALAIKNGLETWEHVLIRKGEPWTPYVSRAAERGAKWCIEDATDWIAAL